MSENNVPVSEIKFALVIGDEVGAIIKMPAAPSNEIALRAIAALQSDPKVVPVPDGLPVEFGWTWDGERFINQL